MTLLQSLLYFLDNGYKPHLPSSTHCTSTSYYTSFGTGAAFIIHNPVIFKRSRTTACNLAVDLSNQPILTYTLLDLSYRYTVTPFAHFPSGFPVLRAAPFSAVFPQGQHTEHCLREENDQAMRF